MMQYIAISTLLFSFLLTSANCSSHKPFGMTSVTIKDYDADPSKYPDFIFECNKEKVVLKDEERKMITDYDSIVKGMISYFEIAKIEKANTITLKYGFQLDTMLHAGAIFKSITDSIPFDTQYYINDTVKKDIIIKRIYHSKEYSFSKSDMQMGVLPIIMPVKLAAGKLFIIESGTWYDYKTASDTIETPKRVREELFRALAFWKKYEDRFKFRTIFNTWGINIFTKFGRYSKLDNYYTNCNPEKSKVRINGDWVIERR